MGDKASNLDRYGELVKLLVKAYTRGDEASFTACLDDLVHGRRRELFAELRKLTEDVRRALERFQLDSRFADLAEREVPDARARLTHVMSLTDDAAHRTMDLCDQSRPFAARIIAGAADMRTLLEGGAVKAADADTEARLRAFLDAANADAEQIRRNLSEVLLAQGYQDLTGQIIRGVITLVGEVETALASLMDLANRERALLPRGEDQKPSPSRGYGPAVPGVDNGPAVSGQQDVDSLLSDLGL